MSKRSIIRDKIIEGIEQLQHNLGLNDDDMLIFLDEWVGTRLLDKCQNREIC